MTDPVQIISLGAGVQSSTMALMAAHGEITPMPAAAIFADTQAEPASVYRWLDWLETKLPFPVHRVTAGSLETDALTMKTTADGRRFTRTSIPYFTRNGDGSLGMVTHRSCTSEYKIRPLLKKARELGQVKRGEKNVRVISWIGISLDEATRMKPSRDAWVENRWPLIDLRIRRADCIRWMEAHGYPEPPRSACRFCPFHNNAEWRRLKDTEPAEFEKAVQFEKHRSDTFDSTPYLHVSRTPLDTVDLSTVEERGQLHLWDNECEGMCGV